MKKLYYIQPRIKRNSLSLKTLCVGIQGSTNNTSGNLTNKLNKEIEEEEESKFEDCDFHYIEDTLRTTKGLW